MRLLLIGNYGEGNFGDEALKQYFLKTFPEYEWSVVSARPHGKEFSRLPMGIRSFLFSRWWKTLLQFRRVDAVVLGGGTLFTDIESVRACILWWLHACAARVFGKPIFLCFQGIGPFRTKTGSFLTRRVLAGATFISVRDAESLKRASVLGSNKKVIQTFDPVFSLFLGQNAASSTKKILTLIPRKNSGSAFRNRALELLESDQWDEVRILSLEPGNKREVAFCQDLLGQCLGKGIVSQICIWQELAENITHSSFVLSERYHGALAALALGKEFEVIAQGSADKLSSLGDLAANRPDENFRESLRLSVLSGENALRAAFQELDKNTK